MNFAHYLKAARKNGWNSTRAALHIAARDHGWTFAPGHDPDGRPDHFRRGKLRVVIVYSRSGGVVTGLHCRGTYRLAAAAGRDKRGQVLEWLTADPTEPQ